MRRMIHLRFLSVAMLVDKKLRLIDGGVEYEDAKLTSDGNRWRFESNKYAPDRP